MKTNEKLKIVHANVAEALMDIKRNHFKDFMKLTFIARDQSDDERTVIITEDDLGTLPKVIDDYGKRERDTQ